jgi:hypothetical protein
MKFKVGDRVIRWHAGYESYFLKPALTISHVTTKQIRIPYEYGSGYRIFEHSGQGSGEKIYLDTPEGWHELMHDSSQIRVFNEVTQTLRALPIRSLLELLMKLEVKS